jgi:Tetratricopeptide repeat
VAVGHAQLLDHALRLAPQPGLAVELAGQMPQHSVQLAALAATLTSQQVTQYRAGTSGGEPDAASLLATSLNNLSTRLGALGRREEALAAIQEAVTIRRELAARWPDAYPAGAGEVVASSCLA